ncbi:hypothetical protein ACOJUR_12370 [Alicyclobacillus tolerans]
MKHLCGYVAIPQDHPWYGLSSFVINADVHGGLTFSRFGHAKECENHPDYKPATDEKGRKLWWVGFDTAHAGDLIPFEMEQGRWIDPTVEYRNFDYVKEQVQKLAEQAEEALRQPSQEFRRVLLRASNPWKYLKIGSEYLLKRKGWTGYIKALQSGRIVWMNEDGTYESWIPYIQDMMAFDWEVWEKITN